METKSRDEMFADIMRDIQENRQTFEAAQRELERDPMFQEMQKWVILDWNKGEESFQNHVVMKTNVFGSQEWYLMRPDHCYVRNFPSLKVEHAHVTDCVFENCHLLTIEDGTVERCVFSKIDTLYLTDIEVRESVFQELRGDRGGMILSMEDSTISECRFKDVQIYGENYLGDGVGDCLIENCHFERVCTERDDGGLFICRETVGKVFKRNREYDMLDRDSCVGLDKEEEV